MSDESAGATRVSGRRALVHHLYLRVWRLPGAHRAIRRIMGWGGYPEAPFAARVWGSAEMELPSSDVGLPRMLWLTGAYQPQLSRCMRRLAAGRVVYDVGANVGYFSALALASGAKEVHAFEPFHRNLLWLRRNVTSANSTVHEVAVGDTAGMIDLYEGGDYGDGSTSAVPVASGRLAGSVPVVALDAFVNERQIPDPDVVKMDIEGFEQRALEGMRALLARTHPSVLIEVNTPLLLAAGDSPEGVFAIFQELGYQVALDVDGRRLRVATVGQAQNVLFVHPTRAADVEAVGWFE